MLVVAFAEERKLTDKISKLTVYGGILTLGLPTFFYLSVYGRVDFDTCYFVAQFFTFFYNLIFRSYQKSNKHLFESEVYLKLCLQRRVC